MPHRENDTDAAFHATVLAALARIEERGESLRRELLGNGQPGRIQRIETELGETKKEFTEALAETNGKVAGLENVRHEWTIKEKVVVTFASVLLSMLLILANNFVARALGNRESAVPEKVVLQQQSQPKSQ